MAISNSLYVIAAVCGNFWRESTVNPGIWESLTVGAPGYGLGQWTDLPQYGLTRRTQLFNWLTANSYTQDSGVGQLEYLVYEDYWTPNQQWHTSAYPTMSDFFASTSTSVSDLTEEWMWHWEGINDSSLSIRVNAANDFLALFQNDPGTRDAWRASNAYLSMNQAKQNALLIMDWFLGSTPPPPGPGPGPSPSDAPDFIKLFMAHRKRQKGGWHVF